jgi:hypothetical protein
VEGQLRCQIFEKLLNLVHLRRNPTINIVISDLIGKLLLSLYAAWRFLGCYLT